MAALQSGDSGEDTPSKHRADGGGKRRGVVDAGGVADGRSARKGKGRGKGSRVRDSGSGEGGEGGEAGEDGAAGHEQSGEEAAAAVEGGAGGEEDGEAKSNGHLAASVPPGQFENGGAVWRDQGRRGTREKRRGGTRHEA